MESGVWFWTWSVEMSTRYLDESMWIGSAAQWRGLCWRDKCRNYPHIKCARLNLCTYPTAINISLFITKC